MTISSNTSSREYYTAVLILSIAKDLLRASLNLVKDSSSLCFLGMRCCYLDRFCSRDNSNSTARSVVFHSCTSELVPYLTGSSLFPSIR